MRFGDLALASWQCFAVARPSASTLLYLFANEVVRSSGFGSWLRGEPSVAVPCRRTRVDLGALERTMLACPRRSYLRGQSRGRGHGPCAGSTLWPCVGWLSAVVAAISTGSLLPIVIASRRSKTGSPNFSGAGEPSLLWVVPGPYSSSSVGWRCSIFGRCGSMSQGTVSCPEWVLAEWRFVSPTRKLPFIGNPSDADRCPEMLASIRADRSR